MSLKPLNPLKIQDTGMEEPPAAFSYAAEQKKIADALKDVPAEVLDADLADAGAIGLEKGYDPEEVLAKMHADQQQKEVGNTLHSREFYDKAETFAPSMEITPPPIKKSNKKDAKPATELDLENLDESMIMNLPQIKAASFELNNFLNLKFKDKTLRGRWANCKNYVQGNLHRFLQLGYEVASVQDIDETKTPVDQSMIDGTTIKYHDVILLKINVVRLMELYKAGILKSLDRLTRAKEKGLAEANRQFATDISNTPGAAKAFNDLQAARGGRPPVEFTLENN